MQERLEKLGFTRSESKIYLELLKKDNLLAGDISKKTGLNRRTVYDSLFRLENKGIVAFSLINNKKHFFPIDPEIIIKKIDEMKKSAKDLIPQLKNLKTIKSESKVYTYKGKEGIMNILRMILKNKRYCSFGSGKQFPETMTYYYEQFQKQKSELKIKSKTILGAQLKSSQIIKSISKDSMVKFLPESLTGNSSTFIFKDKVAILIWEEPFWGILIESESVNKSYMEYFKQLWNMASK
jgi:sugar-specific transcriptional regulator TrmB